MKQSIDKLIRFIYGEEDATEILESVENLSRKWSSSLVSPERDTYDGLPLDQSDSVLICYGDSIKEKENAPLQSMKKFADEHLRNVISSIHILPFSPYSSDDGFSVMDYRKVNPEVGGWKDMTQLGEHFQLMFDLVLNHCSAQSDWFKKYQEGDPLYQNYFIEESIETDLSMVFRPRALPLLHPFDTHQGVRHIWTTFSKDQVDLNFSNPRVMLEFLDILFFYISQGATIIRLDAVGFLWKEIGTSCMHHPKTHGMVQLYRAILKRIAPWVVLLTETNVPHKENISYFGDGANEAQMVYQFALPPLTLDAFLRQDTRHWKHWASILERPSKEHSFFNFLASHDGVGVLPAREYLEPHEMDNLLQEVQNRGGRISYKATANGDIPYELNINYCDAIAERNMETGLRARKFLSSQSLIIALAGVPGIYIHSLLGSQNWQDGIDLLGQNRSINREKMSLSAVEQELADPKSFRSLVFQGFKNMLQRRSNLEAFHPAQDQDFLPCDDNTIAFIRGDQGSQQVLVVLNASSEERRTSIEHHRKINGQGILEWEELIRGDSVNVEMDPSHLHILLEPWQVYWLAI